MREKKSELDLQADELLAYILKSKQRNKSRLDEYPILSDSQMARIHSKEIPESSLSRKQRNEANIDQHTGD